MELVHSLRIHHEVVCRWGRKQRPAGKQCGKIFQEGIKGHFALNRAGRGRGRMPLIRGKMAEKYSLISHYYYITKLLIVMSAPIE